MNNRKHMILILITVFFIGLIITGGSYAFWSLTSSTNKTAVFNTISNLKKYIEYDAGDSKFVGEFKTVNSFEDGIHSTISFSKKEAAKDINILANINMDVNDIGPNMSNSTGIKWTLTEGDSTNVGNVIATGNFNSKQAGDVIYLTTNIIVTTEVQTYTIWIWADRSVINNDNLVGETIDATVWTEINQLESIEDLYEVSHIRANYQNIKATVISGGAYVTNYQITETETEPSTWENVPVNDIDNIYNFNHAVSTTGTYYVWFKNEDGEVVHTSVEVTQIDLTKPVCTFLAFETNPLPYGDLTSVVLSCIDPETDVTNYTLKANDLTIANGNITITNIIKERITNGYSYTITISGNSIGTDSITMAANLISNEAGLPNDSVSSETIEVKQAVHISGAIVTLSQNLYYYDGTAKTPSVTVSLNNNTLTENTDYVVAYTDNINAGTATVTVTGINDYIGSKSVEFTIDYSTFNITLNSNSATTDGTTTLYARYGDGVYLDNAYQNKVTTNTNNITIPIKTNSAFGGYYYNDTLLIDAQGYLTENFTSMLFDEATTLTARWVGLPEIPTYTVKYAADDSAYTAGTWSKDSLYIDISSSSTDTAITKFQYTLDDGTTWTDLTCDDTIEEDNDVYSCEATWTANSNSNVKFRAVDEVGNNTDASTAINIKYDNVLPTGTLAITSTAYTVTSTITINDVTSGDSGTYGWYVSTNSTCDSTRSFIDNDNTSYTYNATSFGTYYVCVRITDNAGNINYISDSVEVFRAGEPVLTDNLIPVTISTNGGTVTAVSKYDSSWFDYSEKNWANAVLTTSTNRSTYQAIANGTESSQTIPTSEILAYYVWIPRYKYSFTNHNGSPEAINIVLESASTTKSTGNAQGTSYYTHPAFTYDGNELEGFWIGKFEISATSGATTSIGCTNNTCSNANNLRILPNVSSLRTNNRVQYFFYGFASMTQSNNNFGLNSDGSVESRMLKNSEWGAVAYLSHSEYGTCTNGTCTEVRLNNNQNYKTGCGASTADGGKNTNCQIAYGTATSFPQSTTGNVTGVFDMAGGGNDYVMGNFDDTPYQGKSGLSTMPAAKYYNKYTSSTYTLAEQGGHALGETTGWYGDKEVFPTANNPWVLRGGTQQDTTLAGIFFYEGKQGEGSEYRTSRAALITY